MTGQEIKVKKYVVRLSREEREQLEDFIGKGKPLAHLATRARILLKADVSDLGEGWSDSRIAEALDTSKANVQRARERLVEEGFDAVVRFADAGDSRLMSRALGEYLGLGRQINQNFDHLLGRNVKGTASSGLHHIR